MVQDPNRSLEDRLIITTCPVCGAEDDTLRAIHLGEPRVEGIECHGCGAHLSIEFMRLPDSKEDE